MKKGVVFRFLDQPELNSEGKYIDFLLTVLAAVAQLERDILDEKRREGIHDVLGLVPQPARAPFSSAASPSRRRSQLPNDLPVVLPGAGVHGLAVTPFLVADKGFEHPFVEADDESVHGVFVNPST
jgi:hypothetical protein